MYYVFINKIKAHNTIRQNSLLSLTFPPKMKRKVNNLHVFKGYIFLTKHQLCFDLESGLEDYQLWQHQHLTMPMSYLRSSSIHDARCTIPVHYILSAVRLLIGHIGQYILLSLTRQWCFTLSGIVIQCYQHKIIFDLKIQTPKNLSYQIIYLSNYSFHIIYLYCNVVFNIFLYVLTVPIRVPLFYME